MKNHVAINNVTVIQKGTRIEGNIERADKVHISGSLIGNINANDHLVIHEDGVVQGNITTPRSEISGKVMGDIRVTDLLVLKGTAQVTGTIYAKYLVTEEGAQFNGTIISGKEVNVLNENTSQENPVSIPQRKAG